MGGLSTYRSRIEGSNGLQWNGNMGGLSKWKGNMGGLSTYRPRIEGSNSLQWKGNMGGFSTYRSRIEG